MAGKDVAKFKYFQSGMRYPRRAAIHIPTVQKFQIKVAAKGRFDSPTNSVFKMKMQFKAPPKIFKIKHIT